MKTASLNVRLFYSETKITFLYLPVVLQFKQSDTTATLILTLSENVSISNPYFLFVFTHVLTKEKVKFIAEDISLFKNRYNKFTINPSASFLGKPIGEWHYKVYEKPDNNTEETGNVLEYGKLKIERATDFSFTKYNEATGFKAYNG